MKISTIVFLMLCAGYHQADAQTATSFASFLQDINTVNPADRPALVDSFMTLQAAKGFPVTEDSTAYFLYRGAVSSSIRETGDHTQWSANGEAMSNISGTDLYYFARKFEPDARIDYKFIKDGNWILDPLNAHAVNGGLGPNSELAMPAYVQPTEIQYNPAIPHGTISSFSFSSVNTGNTRTIQVYLPPQYDSSSNRYPTIYVHDGADYLALGSMAIVLDNLIAAKKIKPIIGVFVPPGSDRAGEYRLSKISQFSNLMVKELVPYIDSVYRTDARASQRATMGSSDGGHIALYLAVNYSGTFGIVGGQSSTITDLFQAPIQNGPVIPVKFYLDVGTYDLSISGSTFLDLNRGFRDLLRSKGYNVTYAEYHEGHSWGNWRAHIDDILKTLFPYSVTRAQPGRSAPKGFGLLNPYPNPFNPSTNFQFTILHVQFVALEVFDMAGRKIETLLHRSMNPGTYSVKWNALGCASGVYFCSLESLGTIDTRKITLLK